MPRIKSAAEIAEKYGRVTPARQADFEAGVKAPLNDWAANTQAAEGSYEQGVQQSIANKSFGKGVAAAGNEKQKRKTLEVGVGRWGTGVRAGQGDFQKGFEAFRQTIEGTTLPPRFPKGDPRNMERVAAIATALHSAKVR